MSPKPPAVVCVHAHQMALNKVMDIFQGWVETYLHQTHQPQHRENTIPGRRELWFAYRLFEARPHDTERLHISPDSLNYEAVLATSPDAHGVITIHVDLTMARLDGMRRDILRAAYRPRWREQLPPPRPDRPRPTREACPICGAVTIDGTCPG